MDNITLLAAGLALVAGMALGGLIAWLTAASQRARLEAQLAAAREQLADRTQLVSDVEQRLAAATGRLASESLERNSATFLKLATEHLGVHQARAQASLTEREQAVASLVQPIRDALSRTSQQLEELEKARHAAFGSIRAQLEGVQSSQQALQAETRNLVTALRRPEVRGRWGEMTLRRIAEMAGMVEHCDFNEQVSTADGSQRPDMLVRLPGGGVLVIDVKTPLDAYLAALEAPDEEARQQALQRHARNLQQRVRELAAKAYWAAFDSSPEMVILFVPGDQFLSAALDQQPGLIEAAMNQRVVLATPGSLMALLTTVAHGWRQLVLAENAQRIRELGEDLYNRMATFSNHLGKLGRQLDSSVGSYNQAVGSFERMVLPGARKLVELGIRSNQAVASPTPVETRPRTTAAAESGSASKEQSPEGGEDQEKPA
ncbi:MAG: DNA recombination protein RmuC [Chromatiales bacterium]|nr:DNA recombination protein RmuC [Chromatiales bacterium]